MVNQEGRDQSTMAQGINVNSNHGRGGFTMAVVRLFMKYL